MEEQNQLLILEHKMKIRFRNHDPAALPQWKKLDICLLGRRVVPRGLFGLFWGEKKNISCKLVLTYPRLSSLYPRNTTHLFIKI
jgi:hypothetical protein